MDKGGLTTVYESTDKYEATFQEVGDHIFFHLEVYAWSPSLLKEFKEKWPDVVATVKDKGYDILFTYSKYPQSVKFWNKIHPCNYVEKFGPDNDHYIGAWDLEEIKDGN